MTSFHNLYLLLCCCVCPSNVLQGHTLTVSDFPHVNVPVGRGGYNNLVPCRPHWEEQDAYGPSLWGSPWGSEGAIISLPLTQRAFPSHSWSLSGHCPWPVDYILWTSGSHVSMAVPSSCFQPAPNSTNCPVFPIPLKETQPLLRLPHWWGGGR